MAKAKQATPEQTGLIAGVSNMFHVFYVFTRLLRTQTEKLETITDIASDAVLHSVQYVDVTTRQNLDEAKKKSLV